MSFACLKSKPLHGTIFDVVTKNNKLFLQSVPFLPNIQFVRLYTYVLKS